MLYPQLENIQGARQWIEQFRGLDRRPRAGDGTFSAMGNMSGDPSPLLSSRPRRGVVAELDHPQAMIAMGSLAWIDGSTLYYGGEATPITDLSTREDMLPKHMVAMGAYIVIFPDGYFYNTADPADWGTLERRWRSAHGDAISFTLCTAEGINYATEDIIASDTAPEDPQDGQYWIDTSGDEQHALYQWHDQWIGISSVYIKMSAPGIGVGLSPRDAVEISGVSCDSGTEGMVQQYRDINNTQILEDVGDDFIIFAGIIDGNYTQLRGRVEVNRVFPRLDCVVESANRLWGCRYGMEGGEMVNRIYSCALGDFKNWQRYAGSSTDSYYVNVGVDGPFTGAATHRGRPYFFKEGCYFTLYGDEPSNFQLVHTVGDGVKDGSAGTVCSYNGYIYYLSPRGPMAMETLGTPIGEALGPGKLSGGAAGVSGGKYWLSAREENGSYSLYVFDTGNGTWHRQDDVRALAFAELGGEMFMLAADGRVLAMNGAMGTPEDGEISWYAETGRMDLDSADHRYTGRLGVRISLEEDGECRILLEADSDGIWRQVGQIDGEARARIFPLPIIPRRCGHVRLRVEGHGDFQLYGISREILAGSDIRMGVR